LIKIMVPVIVTTVPDGGQVGVKLVIVGGPEPGETVTVATVLGTTRATTI